MNKNQFFRSIPKVDTLIEDSDIKYYIDMKGRNFVIDIIRERIEALRKFINETEDEEKIKSALTNLPSDIKHSIELTSSMNIKRVINGTGTILHTNLGRAVLSERMINNINDILTGYSNLEYDLENGERGERYSHFEDIVARVTGAEAAIAVNNNAAAVLLILSTLCKDKEAIVSRGELVEIGGSFRVPDVMAQSGARLLEVGTTNKTHLTDYENAINEDTGVILKVHTSNYKIVGFSESVGIKDLIQVSKKYDIPVIEDIGSGVLIDLSKYGLTYEPTVQNSIKNGADIVCFSGDKLLGGPQAGIIVGKESIISKIKKNPLTRALRIDKFTVAMLESVFLEYLDEQKAIRNIPVLRMITDSVDDLDDRASRLLKLINMNDNAQIRVNDCYSQVGGGSLPLEQIRSKCIEIKSFTTSTSQLEKKLRKNSTPIISRIYDDNITLDMRTISDTEIDIIAECLNNIL